MGLKYRISSLVIIIFSSRFFAEISFKISSSKGVGSFFGFLGLTLGTLKVKLDFSALMAAVCMAVTTGTASITCEDSI